MPVLTSASTVAGPAGPQPVSLLPPAPQARYQLSVPVSPSMNEGGPRRPHRWLFTLIKFLDRAFGVKSKYCLPSPRLALDPKNVLL